MTEHIDPAKNAEQERMEQAWLKQHGFPLPDDKMSDRCLKGDHQTAFGSFGRCFRCGWPA